MSSKKKRAATTGPAIQVAETPAVPAAACPDPDPAPDPCESSAPKTDAPKAAGTMTFNITADLGGMLGTKTITGTGTGTFTPDPIHTRPDAARSRTLRGKP